MCLSHRNNQNRAERLELLVLHQSTGCEIIILSHNARLATMLMPIKTGISSVMAGGGRYGEDLQSGLIMKLSEWTHTVKN